MSQLEIKPQPTPDDTPAGSVIDTSGMSEGKAAALELAEESRDQLLDYTSFAGSLFMGRTRWSLVNPWPIQDADDRAAGDAFLEKMKHVLVETSDPDMIDATGEIPDEVIDALRSIGAMGIKIPKEYGGHGLSQYNYSLAAVVLGGWCGSLTALISAHQSIGVPQPLLVFGTAEQKRRFLPRIAKGEITAFALTEDTVGSDPAQMKTTAEPTEDGRHYVINGEKLWCTNLLKAGMIVVMARTPNIEVGGRKKKNRITAFVVEMDTPGIEIVHRCHFMGLKALYNGVVRFKDVKIPAENVIAAEGKGLRVALTTLNTGRMTLPASCIGMAKQSLRYVKTWSREREQWGSAIGKHAAIADKIAWMTSTLFAMEAMTFLTSSLVDRKKSDIRLEAAMCKMYCTEAAWHIGNEAMQIRGGRGYETAPSLRARGEDPVPAERMVRDLRINLIFEGSSEIMRLFIAREALDPHLGVAGAVLNSRLPMGQRLGAAVKAGLFYAGWYPRQWLPFTSVPSGMHSTLAKHARYVSRTSRKLSRRLFHAMLGNGPKLEQQQMKLARFVEIGTELFASAATVLRAQALIDAGHDRDDILKVADLFCRQSRLRVDERFRAIRRNLDRPSYSLAQRVLDDRYEWMEDGVIRPE